MRKKKNNKKFFTKGERFLYKSCLFIIIMLIVGIVVGQTTLSQVNLEVQKLESKVEASENTNQSLAMKINEMASLDNIMDVSNEMGLTYNTDNIKTISE